MLSVFGTTVGWIQVRQSYRGSLGPRGFASLGQNPHRSRNGASSSVIVIPSSFLFFFLGILSMFKKLPVSYEREFKSSGPRLRLLHWIPYCYDPGSWVPSGVDGLGFCKPSKCSFTLKQSGLPVHLCTHPVITCKLWGKLPLKPYSHPVCIQGKQRNSYLVRLSKISLGFWLFRRKALPVFLKQKWEQARLLPTFTIICTIEIRKIRR